ncbi:MAG: MBOAT family protein [Oscillospiraceae bacterium]|nr:MBOAT family protein [Oscillospiraceae bacterium]
MVFSSVSFLVFFLPALLVSYYLVPRRFREARNAVLLAFSLAFYACGGVRYLALLILSIAINYLCGLLASDAHRAGVRRAAVVLACVLGLGLLGWFKYAGFFARIVNDLGVAIPIPHIALPIGISFFTFQGLSYVIDVARGDAACQRNPLRVALYVALFPQLVAGPIVRYTTVEREIGARDESLDEFTAGLVRFLFGLAKKMLLANAMGELTDSVYGMPQLSASTAWIGAIAYTFQIYFDFSAYSDMAIGLGRMFGFHFLENFNYPYVSASVTEFWRRWHISLSSWFRDYLYIPLGGSRCGRVRQLRNLAVVWLLTGLWHGASWNFIAWGAWFCVLLIGEKFLYGAALERSPAVLRHVYTMLAVVISWVFFRAPTMSAALAFLRAMCGGGAGWYSADSVYYLREYLPELLICPVACLPVRDALRGMLERRSGRAAEAVLILAPKLLALALLGLSYMKLVSGSFNPFIYFQF